MFIIRCDNRIGQHLNSSLGKILRDFVAQELEAAEDEEVSKILRYETAKAAD